MSITRVSPSVSYATDGEYICQVCGDWNGKTIAAILNNGIYQYLCPSCLFSWVIENKIKIGDQTCGSCSTQYNTGYCLDCASQEGSTTCQDCSEREAEVCSRCRDGSVEDALDNKENACDECGSDWRTVLCPDCRESMCSNCGSEEDAYCLDCAKDSWDLVYPECDQCSNMVEYLRCDEHRFLCDECERLMSCTNPKCDLHDAVLINPASRETAQPAHEDGVTDNGSTVTLDGMTIRFQI